MNKDVIRRFWRFQSTLSVRRLRLRLGWSILGLIVRKTRSTRPPRVKRRIISNRSTGTKPKGGRIQVVFPLLFALKPEFSCELRLKNHGFVFHACTSRGFPESFDCHANPSSLLMRDREDKFVELNYIHQQYSGSHCFLFFYLYHCEMQRLLMRNFLRNKFIQRQHSCTIQFMQIVFRY